jgi:hypothetical protein
VSDNGLDRDKEWVADAWPGPFGVRIRYPGDFPEVLPGQERMFINLAAQVRKAILAEIGGAQPGSGTS